jgi:hypothetical protein
MSEEDHTLYKVIYLQRIFKFACKKPLEPMILSTVCTEWQITLQDGWDTAALIYQNMLKSTSAQPVNPSAERIVFRQLTPSHPLETLFRRALKKGVPWIIRAVANAGLDIAGNRPAYGASALVRSNHWLG